MKFGILTVSTRAADGTYEDKSGEGLSARIRELGWEVDQYRVIPDDSERIQHTLLEWCDLELNVVLTTGGTGFSPKDITPEATRPLLEREVPGIAEMLRMRGLEKTPHAILSRGVAGIRGSVLIVNLPGSPLAAVENLDAIAPILPHAVQLLLESPDAEAGHRPIRTPRL
jgi:molybdenum cofactor synthesis domain-containing protein